MFSSLDQTLDARVQILDIKLTSTAHLSIVVRLLATPLAIVLQSLVISLTEVGLANLAILLRVIAAFFVSELLVISLKNGTPMRLLVDPPLVDSPIQAMTVRINGKLILTREEFTLV